MSDVKLSILICTVPGREDKLDELLEVLEPQCKGKSARVEVLVLRDNIERTIGSKRNVLLRAANGEYVVFVDDDDLVRFDYVDKILEALARPESPHLVTFEVWVSGYNEHARTTRFSLRYEREENLADEYRRYPNHIMVWRREIATLFPFDDVSFGEDGTRALRMRDSVPDDRKIVNVPEILYWYRLDQNDSATMRGGSVNPRRLERRLKRKGR